MNKQKKSKKRAEMLLTAKDRRRNLLADCLCVIALSYAFLCALATIFPFTTERAVIFAAPVLLTVVAALFDHVRPARFAILGIVGVALIGAFFFGDGPLSMEHIGTCWMWGQTARQRWCGC